MNDTVNKSSVPEEVQTLRFVFGVYRHGFRAPIYNTYPSDPYQDLNKYFPEGKGGLTKKGKWQLYTTGQALRQKYDSFFGELYSTNKFYFVSTDIERTILSAELLAAGIFPPVSYQKWSDTVDWQPIPIWPDNNRIDKTIVFLNSTVCPRFQNDKRHVLYQCEMKSELLQLYSLLSQYVGTEVNSTDQIFQLWDILSCEAYNGLVLPEWTKNIFPEKMKPTVADLFSSVVTGTEKMLQITAGALLTEINEQFSAKANQTLQPDLKLYLLGGHDVTIIALLHSIGIKKPIIIEPADMLLLELHENENFHSVKVFYVETMNTTVMHELKIPDCESPCELQTFINITKPYTSVDWDLLCQS